MTVGSTFRHRADAPNFCNNNSSKFVSLFFYFYFATQLQQKETVDINLITISNNTSVPQRANTR